MPGVIGRCAVYGEVVHKDDIAREPDRRDRGALIEIVSVVGYRSLRAGPMGYPVLEQLPVTARPQSGRAAVHRGVGQVGENHKVLRNQKQIRPMQAVDMPTAWLLEFGRSGGREVEDGDVPA